MEASQQRPQVRVWTGWRIKKKNRKKKIFHHEAVTEHRHYSYISEMSLTEVSGGLEPLVT